MILILVVVGWSPLSLTDYQLINDYAPPFSERFEPSSSDVVIIESNDDFKINNWTGNGTITNPYVLANETIVGERSIDIRNTRSYFRVQDCILNADEYGIILVNVTNAEIIGSTIYSKSAGIDLESTSLCKITNNTIRSGAGGIRVASSVLCNIANNSIFSGLWFSGVYILDSINSTVIANTILSPGAGLDSLRCNNSIIFNNTIACNAVTIRIAGSTNHSIFGNQFASVNGETAFEYYGSDNSWDDGISLGNAWFDYQGYGEYNISGYANSVDHFPTKYEPTFPMDFNGPYIDASVGYLNVDFPYEVPDFWRFTAIVNDTTGVDTVIITVNGKSHFMIHLPTTEKPDRYVYDHPNPGYMRYSYWANDSLGWSTETGQGFVSCGVFPYNTYTNPTTSTTSNPNLTLESTLIVGSVSLLLIFIVVITIKRKRSIK